VRRTSLFIATLILLSALAAATAAEVVLIKPAAGVANINPVWSPDGKSIAYVSKPTEGAPSIYIATPAGKTRLLLKDADSPVWSPDSKQLAVHSNGLVIVDAATGKAVKRLTTDSPDNVNSPNAWSPTGRYLLYTLNGIAGPQARVWDLKAGKALASSVGDGGAWTNAGKLIAWKGGEAAAIKLIDLASGSSKTLLTGSTAAGAFVPKGDTFAYLWLMAAPTRGEGIYKVDLKSGAAAKQLALRCEQLQFSKDATQFACVSKLIPKKGAEPEMHLYLGNTKNWYFKSVSKGLASPSQIGSAISWSPDGKSIAAATGDGGIKIVKL